MVTCRAEAATPIGVVATDVGCGLVLALLLCADFHRPLPLHGCSTVVLRAHRRLHELPLLCSCMQSTCTTTDPTHTMLVTLQEHIEGLW